MSREESNRLKYTIALIAEFASRFGIGEKSLGTHAKRCIFVTFYIGNAN